MDNKKQNNKRLTINENMKTKRILILKLVSIETNAKQMSIKLIKLNMNIKN